MTQTKDIEQLFRTRYKAMHRQAMLMVRDEEIARDIVHDVFESLLIAGKTDVPDAYLLKAVRSRCLNYIRHLSVRERVKEILSREDEMDSDEQWPDDQTIELIQSTVAGDLTEACRRVVNLRFTDGKTYKEIAALLSISDVAVYKHLRHAIDVLRLKFSHNG